MDLDGALQAECALKRNIVMAGVRRSVGKAEGDKAPREQHASKATCKSASATGGDRKPLHYRPRTESRQEIRRYQKTTELLVHLDIYIVTKRTRRTVGDRDYASVTRCSGLVYSYDCA